MIYIILSFMFLNFLRSFPRSLAPTVPGAETLLGRRSATIVRKASRGLALDRRAPWRWTAAGSP